MENKIFTQSEKYNPNYATRVVRVDNIRKHPNADRLDIITINGDNLIVSKDSVKIDDIMILCAVESALNLDFLKMNNQYRDKELNADADEKTGFFERRGRVKATNLRGEISTGFLFSPQYLLNWQPSVKDINWENHVDVQFDTFNGIQFSKKYVIAKQRSSNMGGTGSNKRNRKLMAFDKLIENQFNFHYDTKKLADHMDSIRPDDIISITAKFHGTSVITSHILVNRELKWYEKVVQKLGVQVEDKKYDFVYSSRGVIKNRYINKGVGSGFYGEVDLWSMAGESLKSFIPKGITLYSEAVGFVPNTGTYIQKDHDYKCNEGEYKIYIYRITCTNTDGVVFEFSARQVQDWCKRMGLNPVVELYYGKAKDIYPELSVTEHWHKNFLERLMNDRENFFMEMDSPHCNHAVPHEGIVIRNDTTGMPSLKLKTKRHFMHESEELDKGEGDIETNETEGSEE